MRSRPRVDGRSTTIVPNIKGGTARRGGTTPAQAQRRRNADPHGGIHHRDRRLQAGTDTTAVLMRRCKLKIGDLPSVPCCVGEFGLHGVTIVRGSLGVA